MQRQSHNYSIVPISVEPQLSRPVPQPTYYISNPAVVAENGMFVHLIIVTTVKNYLCICMYAYMYIKYIASYYQFLVAYTIGIRSGGRDQKPLHFQKNR